ncbi:MAG: ribonuclease D [Rickettsiales bacterium]
MTTHYYQYDLPASHGLKGDIAVDCESLGLNQHRDRMCLIQLSSGDGSAHLVHFPEANYDAPNLKKLLSDKTSQKLLHFARYDVALVKLYLGVLMEPVYCTRTASRLIRTYTDRHGLKDLCREYLDIELSKEQQSSYWGSDNLSQKQLDYAANDVLYLHKLKAVLDERLKKEGRYELAMKVMHCIPTRAELDLAGWAEADIFAHE